MLLSSKIPYIHFCARGLKKGEKIEAYFLNNAISHVMSAQNEWHKILQYASNEPLQIVISNTTEVGHPTRRR